MAVTWRRGDDLTALPYRIGRATSSNGELLVAIDVEEYPEGRSTVLGRVTGFGGTPVDTVILQTPDGALTPVPVDMILEVFEPEMQTQCTCSGEIESHVVVDGPLYPQLCRACRAELGED